MYLKYNPTIDIPSIGENIPEKVMEKALSAYCMQYMSEWHLHILYLSTYHEGEYNPAYCMSHNEVIVIVNCN